MFRFRKISAYDEKYLNDKKRTFEELLGLDKRLDEACSRYDDRYAMVRASYEATKNTDYVSLVMRNDRLDKRIREPNLAIQEAMTIQARDLAIIREKLKRMMEKLFDGSNVIFNNILQQEKVNYDYALALYKELNNIPFIKNVEEIPEYLRKVGIVYSNFMAKEYTRLKQIR